MRDGSFDGRDEVAACGTVKGSVRVRFSQIVSGSVSAIVLLGQRACGNGCRP